MRFDLNNKNQDLEDFKKRINRAARDDEQDSGDGTSGSNRWYLGKNNRNVGSIHSDFWKGTAAELSQCNHIKFLSIAVAIIFNIAYLKYLHHN